MNKRTEEVKVGTRWQRVHNQQIVRVIALNPNGTETIEGESWERRRESFFPDFIANAFTRVMPDLDSRPVSVARV
jgi:hypothetical protein